MFLKFNDRSINKQSHKAVELESVSLNYENGPDILKSIDLVIPNGSFHFLTGASGAGKTSLLKMIYLSKFPSKGKIRLFDINVTETNRKKLPNIRQKLGVIFQDFKLLNHLTAFDNVALPLRIAGKKQQEIQENVTSLLSWVGLENFKDSHPQTLSGGQKQLIAIARAIVNSPQLIIADEPTGSVDDTIAMRLMKLFVELNKLGATIIIATHNNRLIERFNYKKLTLVSGYLEN